MKNENVKKILVIRFSSLGDVLLTTPLLRSIKENYPDADIHYMTKSSYTEIIQYSPYVNRVISVENKLDFSGLNILRKEITTNRYDLIIDAHNNLRTFYLRLFQNTKKLVFRKYSFRKFLLVKLKINRMKDLPPITVRYCNIIPGNKYIYRQPEIHTDENSKSGVKKLFTDFKIPNVKILICIAPSSNHFTKTYPPGYYIELIKMFDKDKYTFLLIGKGRDRDNIEIIKSASGENVIDLCDKLSITEMAEVISKCSLFISGDTGPMHIAEALNIPLIMMAGSSVKEFGFYPQNEKATVLENNGLKCRPCSHIGRSECPLHHFKCMREISPQAVYEAGIKMLG